MAILALGLFFIGAACSLDIDRSTLLIGYSERPGESSASAKGSVHFITANGQIDISLMRKNAPHTTSAVLRAAVESELCPNCRFYRNEARPEQGSLGPPYGLLQGSLANINGDFTREGNVVARRGHVCSIPATKEFFIATCDHSEWGTAHTCWGEIDDMTVVDGIIEAPYRNYTHPDYGTLMRMLEREVPFQLGAGLTTS